MEQLLELIQSYLQEKLSTEAFSEHFMELYFNNRLFEQLDEELKPYFENIVLAISLTNDSPAPEDEDVAIHLIGSEELRDILEKNVEDIDKIRKA